VKSHHHQQKKHWQPQQTKTNNHPETKTIHENAEPCRRESGICEKQEIHECKNYQYSLDSLFSNQVDQNTRGNSTRSANQIVSARKKAMDCTING
jgi:hypothetical protein